ncbi:MAG TPA: hypothetical protein VIU64_02575 [Polyangia bacterium]
MWRSPGVVAFVCLGFGCQSFPDPPVSFVTGLRVLGVRAEPPQVSPPAETRLALLIASTAAWPVEVTWNACLRAPLAGQVVNPSCLTADSPDLVPLGGGSADGSSDELAVTVALPPVSPESLGQPDATGGVYLPLVARVADGGNELTAVYRLRIGGESPANANPTLVSIDGLDDTADGAAARVVRNGDELTLGVTLADGSAETYVAPDGTLATESLTTSWFCTAGEVSVERTSARQPTTVLRLRGAVPAAGQTIDLYAVTRDGRGGEDHAHRTLLVE